MPTPTFTPGVRFSTLDAVVLAVAFVGVGVLGAIVWWYGLIVGIVALHFFLFCNVFRIARSLELLWAVAFIALAVPTVLWNKPGWWVTTVGALGVAVVVIAIEMRKPSYHGLGWRRLNPGLPDWWESHVAQRQAR